MNVAATGKSFPAPIEGQRRIVVIHWQSPKILDDENMRDGLKGTVIDHMRRRVQRKVFRKMQWVCGAVPILWDDDPQHRLQIFHPEPTTGPRKLVIKVYEEGDYNVRTR